MLLVVEIDLAFKHSLLATLQHENRTRLVEDGYVVEDLFGPEDADAVKPRRIVAVTRGEASGQFHKLPVP